MPANKLFNTLYDSDKRKFKAYFVIRLGLLSGYNWHINVTLKSLKMWIPKKK